MQLFQADSAFHIERLQEHALLATRAALGAPPGFSQAREISPAPNLAHYTIHYQARLVALLGVHAFLPELGWHCVPAMDDFGACQTDDFESALVVCEWHCAAVDRRLKLMLSLEALRPLIANMRSLRLQTIYWAAEETEIGVLQRMFGFRAVASSVGPTGLRRYLLRLDYTRSLKGLVECAAWLAVDDEDVANWALKPP